MTDLERLFHQLVTNLSAMDSSRLREQLALREIRDTIVPYRANRRALQLETSEDYELALMSLCAGKGGYARTEPESIRAAFDEEIESPNPDLTLLQQHEHMDAHPGPKCGEPDCEPAGPTPGIRASPADRSRTGASVQSEKEQCRMQSGLGPIRVAGAGQSAGRPVSQLLSPLWI